jgi:hypothetical protein
VDFREAQGLEELGLFQIDKRLIPQNWTVRFVSGVPGKCNTGSALILPWGTALSTASGRPWLSTVRCLWCPAAPVTPETAAPAVAGPEPSWAQSYGVPPDGTTRALGVALPR